MKSITVFCGSSLGTDKNFETEAFLLGQRLARQDISVVYGGAKIGLMGAVADGALGAGGKVVGVIPSFLQTKEIVHEGLAELIVVETMHERKHLMNELSDGVITLPGGFGTLEELFEMLTWGQLGLHQKPIGILNTNGYYDELINLLQTMVDKKLLKEVNQQMVLISEHIDDLFEQMKNYEPASVGKWISKEPFK